MLQFLIDSKEENAANDKLKEIKSMMDSIVHDRGIGVKYMHTQDWIRHMEREATERGLERGLEQGLEQGRAEGLKQGRQALLAEIVSKKYATGDCVEKIATDLLESEEKIREIIKENNIE